MSSIPGPCRRSRVFKDLAFGLDALKVCAGPTPPPAPRVYVERDVLLEGKYREASYALAFYYHFYSYCHRDPAVAMRFTFA